LKLNKLASGAVAQRTEHESSKLTIRVRFPTASLKGE
jgi:hypothetical protein